MHVEDHAAAHCRMAREIIIIVGPIYYCPPSLVQHESVETTIPKRRLLFAGDVQRMADERLTRRVRFGTMAGWENPEPGRPENDWAQCLADDLNLKVLQASERSTESSPLLFGIETVSWPRAAKKSGK